MGRRIHGRIDRLTQKPVLSPFEHRLWRRAATRLQHTTSPCAGSPEVRKFFDQIEAEVKPLVQPFYVTDCPRGHKGTWYDVATGKPCGAGVPPALSGAGGTPTPQTEDGLPSPSSNERAVAGAEPGQYAAGTAGERGGQAMPRSDAPGHRLGSAPATDECFDPAALPPEQRKRYRYEGPEIIYTFWAKHGPCSKPGCGHRTPVFRSPVIAEKDWA